MALESFLVVLKAGAPSQATDRVVSIVKNLRGRVEIITGQEKVIIATFDHSFADRIRKLPYVKLVGGVTVEKRKLMRKKVTKQ